MPDDIELGEHGLYYLTSSEDRGVFIAAKTPDECTELAMLAHEALISGESFRNHIMHDHENGGRCTVPTPDWMTPNQRHETTQRLAIHMRQRFAS